MGTQATADTTTTASEAVEMPECEAPTKKKKSSAKKNTQQEDVEVLAPSIQPATKTAKRFAKLDQSKIEEKLSVTQSRLDSAKTKFVRLKREELALHAAIRIKTQGPDCEDATKQAKRASASAKKSSGSKKRKASEEEDDEEAPKPAKKARAPPAKKAKTSAKTDDSDKENEAPQETSEGESSSGDE